jgi:hypothetical protein
MENPPLLTTNVHGSYFVTVAPEQGLGLSGFGSSSQLDKG